MDEAKIQAQRRNNDEESTERRAAILGLQYLDTRQIEQALPLVEGLLSVDQMHKDRIIPLVMGSESEPYRFAVTSTTPQSLLVRMEREYADDGKAIQFFLISQSGYDAFMLRYDPPPEIHYDDIEIAKEGDSETIASVSKTLNSVGTDMVFDYLVQQADKLGASDIHIENQRSEIRVRMRVDGALHSVAILEKDRYRVLMAALSSQANISTASRAPQSGHMHKEIYDPSTNATHLLNLRVEAVPTMYGQDVVLRLFNFNTDDLNLDLLGIAPRERKEIDEVVSHPRGMLLMVAV